MWVQKSLLHPFASCCLNENTTYTNSRLSPTYLVKNPPITVAVDTKKLFEYDGKILILNICDFNSVIVIVI